MQPRLETAGDRAVCLRFPSEISAPVFEAVQETLARLERVRQPEWLDVVPGYASILIVLDPARAIPGEVAAALPALLAQAAAGSRPVPRRVEIPVFYHPAVAPDLEPTAATLGMAVEELVARHRAPVYRCHLLGFRPGFPFLGGLDPALVLPRLDTPRLRVAGGSVAIAAQQTGIYPGPGPGGWRILGRTPLRLFEAERIPPALVAAGDEVVFVPIDLDGFRALGGTASAEEKARLGW